MRVEIIDIHRTKTVFENATVHLLAASGFLTVRESDTNLLHTYILRNLISYTTSDGVSI